MAKTKIPLVLACLMPFSTSLIGLPRPEKMHNISTLFSVPLPTVYEFASLIWIDVGVSTGQSYSFGSLGMARSCSTTRASQRSILLVIWNKK